MLVELFLNDLLDPHKDDADAVFLCRLNRTGDNGMGRIIPAHSINSDLHTDSPHNIKGKEVYQEYSIIPLPLSARTLNLLDSDDFAAIVGAAGNAGVVRFFDLLALRADREARSVEVFMRAPFVSA
jgi:hypothetical protein